MRLICPNCGAQYEVPTNVIPEGGRDVQCSNCGHTWFQAHPDDDPELAYELGRTVPDEDWTPENEPEPDAEQPGAPAPAPEDIPEPEPDPSPAPPPPAAAAAVHRPRGLDPSVAEVLREEAEREARKRASEAETLESQPELGLGEPDEDEAARRSREARERMARMRGEETPATPPKDTTSDVAEGAAVAAAAAASSRRELLPDIDEINQTLRASSARRAMETPQGRAAIEEETEAKRSGFSNGFRLVLGLAIFAVAIYLLAPKISELFPGLATTMEAYVAKVDTLRLWLDGQIAAVMEMLSE